MKPWKIGIVIGCIIGLLLTTYITTNSRYFQWFLFPLTYIGYQFPSSSDVALILAPFYVTVVFGVIGGLIGFFTEKIRTIRRKNLIFIILIFIMFLPSIVNANEIENISIKLDGTPIIRFGNEALVRITVINMNDITNVTLEKLNILNSNQDIVKTEEINRVLKPMKNELIRLEELESQLEETCNATDILQEYQNLSFQIKNETFSKSYILDINDFNPQSKTGDEIFIIMNLEFMVGYEKYIISRNYSTTISEPLPKADIPVTEIREMNFVEGKEEAVSLGEKALNIENEQSKSGLPFKPSNWYAGDQHLHTDRAYDGSVPMSDMVVAAKSANLDWVIFTDHSQTIGGESGWINGYNDCVDETTSTFKCMYGQELALDDNNNWPCDVYNMLHYLAHPYSSNYLGYIDGTCGWLYCSCRDAQTVINEVNNAGGMGFIAHPYDHGALNAWLGVDDWSLKNYTGIEFWNGDWDDNTEGKALNNPSTSKADSWQEFLQIESNPNDGFVVGIGDSDAHEASDVGKTFTYCYLNSFSSAEIRNALKKGLCVVSNGPLVTFKIKNTSIGGVAKVCSGLNTININAYSNSEFGLLDRVDVYKNGNFLTYASLSGYTDSINLNEININSNDKYIYLQLSTQTGKKAYTNPIWFNVTSTCNNNDGCCPSGCVLSNDNDCAQISISCTGSTTHNCSSLNSVRSIDSVSLNDITPYPGQRVTAIVNWTGWHWGDDNHWAFFLDNSSSPIQTCKSYRSDENINNSYSMTCSIVISSDTSEGLHQLKITANDYLGYCNPGELGVDAESSIIINVTPHVLAKTTFMVYLDADNDLESFGIDDINEMEMVGSTPEINIIVQIDRAVGFDASNEDWKGARRYFINHDTDGNVISSTLLDDLDEVDMADPNTLINFTTWGMQSYPAEKYVLVLWNHGSGWKYISQTTSKPWEDKKGLTELQSQKETEKPVKGIIVDYSSGNTLSLEELKQALNTIKINTNKTIDLLGFDACLMQMVEVNYQVRNYSKVVVGSEQTEPGDGWPYDLILTNLTNNPDWNPYQLGSNIVSNYMASYSPTSGVTQSAVNQTKISNLKTRIDNFAEVLSNNLVNYKTQIKNVRENTQSYNDDDYIDFYHFAQLIKSYIPDSTIQNAANQVMESVNETVFAEAHGSGSPYSHGLTIYFPKTKIEFMSSYKTIDFSIDASWDDFLEKYYSNSQIVPGTHILLVDDDNGKGYEEFYKNALNYWIQLGYNYDYSYWDVYSDGSPTLSLISNYSLLIWFTGDDWSTTLTTIDQENLVSYLDNGGSLFVSGQDIGFDIGTSGLGESSISFIYNYLHTDFLYDDTNDDYVNGIIGDQISNGIDLNLTGGNNNYPSAILPVTNATSIFRYATNGSVAGLKYDGKYKIVYLAFPFESINNNLTQATLMDRIISWINPTLSDLYAPVPYGYSVDLGYIQPGGEVTITTRVYEKNQISSVIAEIENPDENVIKSLTLYDDGFHGDYNPNDGIYGNRWTTSLGEDYLVDFVTEDNIDNEQTWNNMLRFTTKPFNTTSKILVIHQGSYWNYYSDALIANSYTYDLYNISERGVPYTSLFSTYVNGVVVWIQPFGGPDKTSQEKLIQYLDLKGNLFISGQDIGWHIFSYGGEVNNSFYNNYLRATYVQDDSNLYALNGTSEDPIGDGIIKMWIAGGNGADNQYWPSEIDPRGEAKIIFRYDPNSTIIGRSIKTDHITDELYKNKQKIGDKGILSSGTAAISVNSTYKVIYFAFGFEAINSTNERDLVMGRVINWLMPVCTPNWLLNDTWTECVDGMQYRYYYDSNKCNKTETMPPPLNRTCEYIEIHSPKNKTYDQRRILVNASVMNKSKYIYTSLNGERFSRACSDCNSAVYTDYAREGSNELRIMAMNYDGSSFSSSMNFFVDTKKPTISKVVPENKEYSKGITRFSIKYTEDNLENMSVFYGASALNEFVMPDCPSGRYQECFADIDLSSYDGKQVQYYFVVRDQVHNVSSTINTIFIDNKVPVVTVSSPEAKPPVFQGLYTTRRIPLTVNVSENVERLEMSIDWGRFSRLCGNCNYYNRVRSFDEGKHTLTIKATDKAGNEGYAEVQFIVDSVEPKIRSTSPEDGEFVKGLANFTVEYDEEALYNVSLYYGVGGVFNKYSTNNYDICPPGRRQKCTLTIDLSDYDNKTVEYYFVVRSIFYNDSSEINSVIVDSTNPMITLQYPENKTYDTNYVRLLMNVSEKVELLKSVNGNRFTRLCNNCNLYDRTSYFRDGVYNVTFLAIDRAGNDDYASVVFTVE